jgi:hypothetical protein
MPRGFKAGLFIDVSCRKIPKIIIRNLKQQAVQYACEWTILFKIRKPVINLKGSTI